MQYLTLGHMFTVFRDFDYYLNLLKLYLGKFWVLRSDECAPLFSISFFGGLFAF